MARVRLDLDSETFQQLLRTALAERRPVDWQAEIMLRRALGLPFPHRGNKTIVPVSRDAQAAHAGEESNHAER